jgi:hypothetical protein
VTRELPLLSFSNLRENARESERKNTIFIHLCAWVCSPCVCVSLHQPVRFGNTTKSIETSGQYNYFPNFLAPNCIQLIQFILFHFNASSIALSRVQRPMGTSNGFKRLNKQIIVIRYFHFQAFGAILSGIFSQQPPISLRPRADEFLFLEKIALFPHSLPYDQRMLKLNLS